MTWLDRKQNWLGRDRQGGRHQPPAPPPERSYSVSEVAELLSVSRSTVFKWLLSDNGDAVIPPDAWYKLPTSGHIRIREWIISKLQGGN